MSDNTLAAADARSDPLRRDRFLVTVEDLPPTGFVEVHGLSVTVQAQPGESDSTPAGGSDDRDWWDWNDLFDQFADAGPPTPKRSTTAPNLELRRGVTPQLPLFGWLRGWVEGTIDARDVRIALLDERGEPAVEWVCESATPVEWTGPTLTTDPAAVAMESLELAHHGITLADTG